MCIYNKTEASARDHTDILSLHYSAWQDEYKTSNNWFFCFLDQDFHVKRASFVSLNS